MDNLAKEIRGYPEASRFRFNLRDLSVDSSDPQPIKIWTSLRIQPFPTLSVAGDVPLEKRVPFDLKQFGMVIKFDNHLKSQPGGRNRNLRFPYHVRRFRRFVVIKLLFTCAQDGEQQAVMEVKFWPEKFQGG